MQIDPPLKPGPGEPPAGPWKVLSLAAFLPLVFDPASSRAPVTPFILGVDGRSGSGKSTIAGLLHEAVPASAVVHTDDVAWHHSFFDWSDLLIENILQPVRRREVVRYRPPGWRKKGRPGEITVPADLDLLIVEGVGAGRRELIPWLDRLLWVQADWEEAERRGIARDGGTAAAAEFWHEWMAAEVTFLAEQRPWTRAALFINGTPPMPIDPRREVVVSPPPAAEKGER